MQSDGLGDKSVPPYATLSGLGFLLVCFFELFESGHSAGGVVDAFRRLWAAVAFGGGIVF